MEAAWPAYVAPTGFEPALPPERALPQQQSAIGLLGLLPAPAAVSDRLADVPRSSCDRMPAGLHLHGSCLPRLLVCAGQAS
jgi:hypothetical protein